MRKLVKGGCPVHPFAYRLRRTGKQWRVEILTSQQGKGTNPVHAYLKESHVHSLTSYSCCTCKLVPIYLSTKGEQKTTRMHVVFVRLSPPSNAIDLLGRWFTNEPFTRSLQG